MITALLTLVMAVPAPADTLTDKVDTLRQVEVRGDSVLPVNKAFRESIKAQDKGKIKIPTVGDLLEKVLPGINDKVTHPFAIKERRRERKHKKDRKILEDFDKVKTIQDLLDEAVQRQQLEDEAARRKEGK